MFVPPQPFAVPPRRVADLMAIIPELDETGDKGVMSRLKVSRVLQSIILPRGRSIILEVVVRVRLDSWTNREALITAGVLTRAAHLLLWAQQPENRSVQ
jgi:hypothetical protein